MTLTRRQTLLAAATLPLATTATLARASAPMMGVSPAPFNRVKLGAFEVTTLLAGTRSVPDPQNIFGMNVDAETFAAASAEANLPIDAAQFFFTPTLVNTGAELVLFDTGLSAAGTLAAVTAAGYTADQVDIVVITHMHGDHIGGMMNNGAPTYPNARYVTGQKEYDAWAKAENEGFDNNIRPMAEQTTFLDAGQDVVTGITSVAAFGHTPGHMTYRLTSDGKSMLLGADFANHYVWSLAHPTWEVKFDQDKTAAAETRQALLSMMAAEKMPFVGYHMPWPGIGYVETRGEGFHYVPHSYQLML